MLTKFTHNRLTWIDLESPTKEDVREVMERYDIHPLVAEELLVKTLRPKVDYYSNHIYLVLHFPTVTHSHYGSSAQEIDFIISKNFLITVHYEAVDPLLEFSKIFEVNSVLERSNMGEHAGFLFFYIMRELYKNLTSELELIGKSLVDIESKIFAGNERAMVETISAVNRKLINFKQAFRFHKNVLESFETAAIDLFGSNFAFYARTITGEQYEIANLLESHKETLVDLGTTNDSLLTNKINEVMKIIAIISFVTFPLSLIAAIFSMEAKDTPLIGMDNDFWYIITAMLALMIFIFAFFKTKRWI